VVELIPDRGKRSEGGRHKNQQDERHDLSPLPADLSYLSLAAPSWMI
jgi:hypothetical protein